MQLITGILIVQYLLMDTTGGVLQWSVWGLVMAGVVFLLMAAVILYYVRKRKMRLHAEMQSLEEKIRDVTKQSEHLKNMEETMLNEKIKELKVQIEDMTLNFKALQDSLKKVEEDSLRNSMLLSSIGSSIRTNLNGIIGFSILLENEFALNEEDELFEYTRSIKESGEELMYLLNNIIDINRMEANTLALKETLCDLPKLLEEVIAEYKPKADNKKLKLMLRLEEIPVFFVDTEALKHVMINILDNAVKFTEKGYVKVSATYNPQTESVEIRVKDTGIGIDKAYLPDLFEPYRQYSLGYSQKNYQGIGLGLPLVKKLLDKMHGAIEIESEKMVGTTVTVTIPFNKSAAPKAESRISDKEKTLEEHADSSPDLVKSDLNILVVDSEKLDGMLLKKMLERYGEVSLSTRNDDALKKVEAYEKQKRPLDLVIIDTKVNSLKAGNQTLLNSIKRKMTSFKQTVFIALAPFPQLGEKEELLRQGFDEYLVKPVIKRDLIKVINNVFANKQIS